MSGQGGVETSATEQPARRPCPAPADFRAEVATYDQNARVGVWQGPRYRMTYRVLGEGPPLILAPGIASTYRGYALTLNRLAARFKTVVYDYPGDDPHDGARLRKIGHDHLVDDVFGLIDHLRVGRAFLLGLSFGSTVVLGALRREPRRFPRALIQGAFAHRRLSAPERIALRLGRLLPGTLANAPFRQAVLTWNGRSEFPDGLPDRWAYYLEQNGLTPIASMAHRCDLLARLDLRPGLSEITSEVFLFQGNEDRIVPRHFYEDLCAKLPNANGRVFPLIGHQPHFTHAEVLAATASEFFAPCAPESCSNRGHEDENTPSGTPPAP